MEAKQREKTQYTGELTKSAVRRVQSEQLDFQKNPMYEDGIFFQCGDQLHACKALVIGPPETPYQFGFYLFDIKYPNTYPWDPPQVTFMTSDRRVRLNPNLYVGGKVCLSILGTWSGPPWTPGLTLRTVMLSIQSLLHAHPLQNEPAFAKVAGERDERYSRILSYENIAVAVLRMLEYTPEGFEVFKPHMGYYFLRALGIHKAVMALFDSRQNEEEESPLGAFKTVYDPSTCNVHMEEWSRRMRSDHDFMAKINAVEVEMRTQIANLPSVFGDSPPELLPPPAAIAKTPSNPSLPTTSISTASPTTFAASSYSSTASPTAGSSIPSSPSPPSPPPPPTVACPPVGPPPSSALVTSGPGRAVHLSSAAVPPPPPPMWAAPSVHGSNPVVSEAATASGSPPNHNNVTGPHVPVPSNVEVDDAASPNEAPESQHATTFKYLCRCWIPAKGRISSNSV